MVQAQTPSAAVIFRDFGLDAYLGRSMKFKAAVQLPQRVLPERFSMRKKVMAASFSLCPIASVVNMDKPERPRHPDDHAKINQQSFERLRAFVSAVD